MKRSFYIIALICLAASLAAAQTTAFNFQGRLNDGSNPANGRYDLQFLLYDAPVGGNQVGAIVTKPNTMLINGVFSTQLDFGANAFTGGDRFLEIQLRPTGSTNAYVILGARQQLLSVPYAVKSLNATNATNAANSQNAVNATNAANADNALNLAGISASRYLKYNEAGNVAVGDCPNNVITKLCVQGSVYATGFLEVEQNAYLRGNTIQSLSSNGLPKAILRLDRDGNITRCYNGLTGASTGNCGFSVSHFALGGYDVNFGFSISNLVINATTELDGSDSAVSALNRGPGLPPTVVRISVQYREGSVLDSYTNTPLNIVVY